MMMMMNYEQDSVPPQICLPPLSPPPSTMFNAYQTTFSRTQPNPFSSDVCSTKAGGRQKAPYGSIPQPNPFSSYSPASKPPLLTTRGHRRSQSHTDIPCYFSTPTLDSELPVESMRLFNDKEQSPEESQRLFEDHKLGQSEAQPGVTLLGTTKVNLKPLLPHPGLWPNSTHHQVKPEPHWDGDKSSMDSGDGDGDSGDDYFSMYINVDKIESTLGTMLEASEKESVMNEKPKNETKRPNMGPGSMQKSEEHVEAEDEEEETVNGPSSWMPTRLPRRLATSPPRRTDHSWLTSWLPLGERATSRKGRTRATSVAEVAGARANGRATRQQGVLPAQRWREREMGSSCRC